MKCWGYWDHFKFIIDAGGLHSVKLQSVCVYFMSVHSKMIFNIIQTLLQGKIITGMKSFFLFFFSSFVCGEQNCTVVENSDLCPSRWWIHLKRASRTGDFMTFTDQWYCPATGAQRQKTCCGSLMRCSRSSGSCTGRRRSSLTTWTTASSSWPPTWSKLPPSGRTVCDDDDNNDDNYIHCLSSVN